MSQSAIRGLIVVGAILFISVIAASARSRNVVSHADQPPAVYICRESKEVFFGTISPQDVVHPVTGRATLSPAIYCPQCETWQPAPPTERRYNQAEGLLCPKCRTPRSFAGELPETATEL
jgi:hypothetical protein